MNQKKRLEYMDIAKGIGMLAIIIGHAGVLFEKYVFPFHVPLFFIISGYFINLKKDFGTYAKAKVKQLLLPYIVTSFVVILELTILAVLREQNWKCAFAKAAISAVYGSGSTANRTPFSIQPIGAIWFLLALLWALLLTRLLAKIKYSILVLIILLILSVISSKFIWLPWSLQSGVTASIFVYIGILAKEKIKFDNTWAAIAGTAVYLIEVYMNVSLSLAKNYFGLYGLSAVGAVLISYAVIYFSKQLGKIRICEKILGFIGKNTLSILCFHLIEITAYPWGHFHIAIDVVLLIVFPLLCALIKAPVIAFFQRRINSFYLQL